MAPVGPRKPDGPYGGMRRNQLKRQKKLETESTRLRRAVSDLTSVSEGEKQMIQWIICTPNDPRGGHTGKLHSTIVLGPMGENGLILPAAAVHRPCLTNPQLIEAQGLPRNGPASLDTAQGTLWSTG